MKNPILIFNQMIVWLVMFFILPFYKITINDKELTINKSKKYIVVANHAAKIDPFIITSLIPRANKFRLLPYRYLITDDYLKRWYWRWPLYWCGCFSTAKEKNNGQKPLILAQKFIQRGETVFIFPEGRINLSHQKDDSIPIGVGAIYLEKHNPDLYLLPVKIEYGANRQINLSYRQPFRHNHFPTNLRLLAEDLMSKIYQSDL